MATKFTHSFRAFKLNKTIGLMPAEISAGEGLQEKQLLARCKSVHAIDFSAQGKYDAMHFPVAHYDGQNIPLDDSFFYLVYLSNVLEHVADTKKLYEEMHRVLRLCGLAIHSVPSAIWRIWTRISHLLYVIKWIFNLVSTKLMSNENSNIATDAITKSSWSKLLRLPLFASRDGEYGSVVSETWLSSRRHWSRHFEKHNWHVIDCQPSKIPETNF